MVSVQRRVSRAHPGAAGYTISRQPSYAYNHYDFNITDPGVSDPVVRQALRLALNRQALVDKVQHGVGIVQDSVQDIDEQLELVRGDWKKIGVALSVQHHPPALMFAPLQKGGVVNGDTWDVITFAWAADPIGDFSSIYGCTSFPPAGQNDLRWCNKTAQRAMDALVEHYEPSDRIADLKVFMREFINDAPSIVSSVRVDLFAYNKDLKNYQPNTITPFDNMMDVDI